MRFTEITGDQLPRKINGIGSYEAVLDPMISTENRKVTGSMPVGATALLPSFYMGVGLFRALE